MCTSSQRNWKVTTPRAGGPEWRRQATGRPPSLRNEQANSLFRCVMDSTIDAVVVSDERGHIVAWNQAATVLFRREEGETLGRPLTIIMPKRYRKRYERGLEALARGATGGVAGKVVEEMALRDHVHIVSDRASA